MPDPTPDGDPSPARGAIGDFLVSVVGGAAFADVGGLIGVAGETLSIASRAGAASVTMIDVVPPTDPAWTQLRRRLADLGVARYECLSGDVHDLALEPFDVVHSGAVLHHMPNPLAHLARLRSLARRHVVLTSAIVPRLIVNRHGMLRVSDASPLFVPAMSERQRRIYAWFHAQGDPSRILWGISAEAPYWPTNYSAWWWLLPVATIRRMAEACGFEVERDAPDWNGRGHTFLLRNTGRRDGPPVG